LEELPRFLEDVRISREAYEKRLALAQRSIDNAKPVVDQRFRAG
jgi:hypothetical protein